MDEKLPEKSQQEPASEDAVTELTKNEKQEQTPVAAPEPTSPPNSASIQSLSQKRSGPGWIIWGITLLIVLAGAGASVYLWKSGEDRQQQLRADVAGAIQRVDEQTTLVRDVRRELDRYDGLVRQQQKQAKQQIDDLNQQLASQQKRIQSLSTTDRNDWLLAEAEYLLQLANQRLLMGKEVGGAQQLLNAADEIIRDLNDYALFPVRKALADDMAALHAVGRFDLEGLYLQLDAAALQAAKLRLLTKLELDTSVQPIPGTDDVQERLELGIKAALDKLGKYVQYSRRDEIYKPTLAPEYEPAVRQNVKLMFEQAQMALLAGNQSLYDKSLLKAKDWLSSYYTLDQEATAKVVAMIETLQQKTVAMALPDISGSSNALKDYLDSLHIKKNNKKTNQISRTPQDKAKSTPEAVTATGSGDSGKTL